MGNCQAVDNATLIIQHPNGKVDKLFFPVSADEIIKANPGHYVALLLTTTLYSPTSAAAVKSAAAANTKTPLRVTRIKLLRPTDTLLLGHVYRLVTTEEVMKGLWAKKQAKMQQQQKNGNTTEKNISDFEAAMRKKHDVNNINQERHRTRNNTQVNSATSSKSRSWQPGLKSISESGS